MPCFTSSILIEGYYFDFGRAGGAFGSLHVVLGSARAAFRIFLVEGDSFGFAHEGELDIDAVEEVGRKQGGIGCAGCDGREFGPVPGDERGIVDAKAGIERRICVDQIEKASLFGAHCPWIFLEAFEEAERFVFVVELVGYCGDGGATKKTYRFVEACFECGLDVIGEGDTFVAGRYLRERTEALAEPEGEGFGSRLVSVSRFGLLSGLHNSLQRSELYRDANIM
jgi:hypothetical protein